MKPGNTKSKASYPRFIGFELFLTAASFFLAYFAAIRLYAFIPGVFDAVASLITSLIPGIAANGFSTAYVAVAGLIWVISNSLLFVLGLRKL